MFSAAAIALAAWGLHRMAQSESQRFWVREHTAVQSKAMSLVSGFGLASIAEAKPGVEETQLAANQALQGELKAGPAVPDANMLLITVDALRADHMGIYGYKRATTRHIDRWAKNAVVFERGYCPVPHTSFSVTSILTSRHVYSSGGGRIRTLPSVLRRYGYKTAGFFPPAVFYIDGDRFKAYEASRFDFEYVKYEFMAADERVDQVLSFLKEYGASKFFIWIHLFEPHEPYRRHRDFDFGPRAVDRYDSEIAYTDRAIGRLIDVVQKDHPKTIIALTGDHGEAFGEHGSHYHGNTLYEEQIRVPAIVSVPGVQGRRVGGSVRSIDLPVTMMSSADVALPMEMEGTDLGPWLVGEDAAKLPAAIVELRGKRAIIDGDSKLIRDRAWSFSELYNLGSDPSELHNIAPKNAAIARRLERKLERWAGREHDRKRRSASHDGFVAQLFRRARARDNAVVPDLIALYKRGTLEAKRNAVVSLLQLRAREGLSTLVVAADHSDPGVNIPATIGAALLGHKASLKQLSTIEKRPDLPRALRRDIWLARAARKDRKVTRALVDFLRDSEDIYERTEIIDALGKLGDPVAAPALLDQLTTLRTRRQAMEALGQIRARQAVPSLIRALNKDRFISWRRQAAHSLGVIGDVRAVQPLQTVVVGEIEGPVVAQALGALARMNRLHLAGVKIPSKPNWTCADQQCTADIDAQCGRSEELLLVMQPNPDERLEVWCGKDKISELRGSQTPQKQRELEGPAAAVIPLKNRSGAVMLKKKGESWPVRYVALRRAPVGQNKTP